METRSVNLNRRQLSEFIKSPETIKAFENLSLNGDDYATVIGSIQGTPVVSTELSGAFPDGRVIATDGEVQATDGGPGQNYTLGLSNTGVSAGDYGNASSTVRLQIDAKGRVRLAQAFSLVSDNVAEGATNLYFTQARARASLSATLPISYNMGTGEFALGIVPEALGGTGFTSYLAGDLIYAASGSALARLGIGPNNSVLTSNGSLPSWTGSTGSGSVVRASSPIITSPTINGTPVYSGAPGSTFTQDVSAASLSVPAGGTINFPNFSGTIVVNDYVTGGVELWLVGGGFVASLGATTTIGGAFAFNPGISGYTFTNTSGSPRPFAFSSTRTRTAA